MKKTGYIVDQRRVIRVPIKLQIVVTKITIDIPDPVITQKIRKIVGKNQIAVQRERHHSQADRQRQADPKPKMPFALHDFRGSPLVFGDRSRFFHEWPLTIDEKQIRKRQELKIAETDAVNLGRP